MDYETWKQTIINACESIGTYREEFDSVIDSLAQILERRDIAYRDFVEKWGGETIYTYPNKTIGLNPALSVWDSLNKSALTYWKDLGLTPAGLKRITSFKPKVKSNQPTLEELIDSMLNEESE